ncbi:MAG: cytochrome c oxidase assembly protein [Ilumatobacteraceae bacterium]
MAAFVEYQWHPEVWLLVGFLVVAYTYMVRVIGPKAVPAGQPAVARHQIVAFAAAMLLLWLSSDWPVHDVAEGYLYSVHMFQHMALTFFVPPLALLATPTWLMRSLIGRGATYRVVKRLAHPVVAAVVFNATVMVIHIPALVNASTSNGPLHYLLHVMIVGAAFMMWMPVVGPISEFRLGPLGASIYLFLQSVVPTIPAGWLVFAEGVVYGSYGDQPIRLWGVDVIADQQFAGAIMKLAGGVFLWAFVVYFFFARFARGYQHEHDYRRRDRMPDAEIIGNDETDLTTADVERAFAASEAAPGPD